MHHGAISRLHQLAGPPTSLQFLPPAPCPVLSRNNQHTWSPDENLPRELPPPRSIRPSASPLHANSNSRRRDSRRFSRNSPREPNGALCGRDAEEEVDGERDEHERRREDRVRREGRVQRTEVGHPCGCRAGGRLGVGGEREAAHGRGSTASTDQFLASSRFFLPGLFLPLTIRVNLTQSSFKVLSFSSKIYWCVGRGMPVYLSNSRISWASAK